MIPTKEDVIRIAESFVGYKEKKSNAYLDDFEKNAGSNNYSCFARDVSIPKYWNGNKQNADWCTSFITACLIYACGGKRNGGTANQKYYEDVKSVQPYTSMGASCAYQTSKYKSVNRWSATPEVGYQAFFKRGHTGLVVAVNGNKITLVEGNSNNRVEKRTYSFPNEIFTGFGMPRYKASPNPSVKTHNVVSTDTPERIARKYGITPAELLAANKAKYPTITIDFIRDGWVLIIPEHKEGFVAYSAMVDAENGLNVRTGAGTSYKKIGVLPYGTKIKILEVKDKWGRHLYNGKDGWSALQYTRKI